VSFAKTLSDHIFNNFFMPLFAHIDNVPANFGELNHLPRLWQLHSSLLRRCLHRKFRLTVFSNIYTRASSSVEKNTFERRALAEQYACTARISDERVNTTEVAGIVQAAADALYQGLRNGRGGWQWPSSCKQLLQCDVFDYIAPIRFLFRYAIEVTETLHQGHGQH
jgi:hypothetical protein